MTAPRVWITGVGLTTSLGSDRETFSDNLLAGRSPVQIVVDRVGDHEFRSPGCLLPPIPVPAGWTESDFRKLLPGEQAALWSCSSALADAGWLNRDDVRIGIVLGCGGEWVNHWENDCAVGGNDLYESRETESIVSLTRARLGLRGPSSTVAAACASGNYALAVARNWIQQGLVDVCVAGAVEVVTPICRATFHNLRALSRNVDNFQRASRPFDKERHGFVMAEGAVAHVLESEHVARRRGANVLAEVAGFGASSDAFHMIIPSKDPQPAMTAMRGALVDAQITPDQVSYVNAHAPGTSVGDDAEARALMGVFGAHTASTPVSSTKSITGHLLSAAASLEALASITAIQRQALPPTINLDDPEHELCHIRNQSQAADVRVVMSNSFGFGGSNTSLVLRKVA
ncbi:beta-ketoacyl-[acyl-carrier-protein] synthase family protein [Anatilimnocola floriformis]|uniref:beta-ketoacyl-[acyl-carrier-protein] synthase family protein n=1 Tax=Anatilimnocola floriformis TaxID=2948575 RepID=UPI0020C33963|nr:beta-ketoacyl-[acyl-carrier-protein] synthase family protein [Anatilimnocola floriformis]